MRWDRYHSETVNYYRELSITEEVIYQTSHSPCPVPLFLWSSGSQRNGDDVESAYEKEAISYV